MEHLELRLDRETKRFLEDWARAREVSVGEAVRRLVREGLGLAPRRTTREEAAREILGIGLSGLPAPENLEEEIHDAFGGDSLY